MPDCSLLKASCPLNKFLASYRSGCAAGCCPKDTSLNPQGEYEEEMRLPSTGGAGGGAHCCRYAVSGALFFLHATIPDKKKYEDGKRHPSTGGTDGGGGC